MEPVGVAITTPSQPIVDSGRPSTSRTTSQHPLAGGLLDGGLVERPGPGDLAAADADDDVDRHPLLDVVVPGHDPLDRQVQVLLLGLGQEADVPQVDAQHGDAVGPAQLGAAQDRAVAAEADDQLAAFGRVLGVGDHDLGPGRRRARPPRSAAGRPAGRPRAAGRSCPVASATAPGRPVWETIRIRRGAACSPVRLIGRRWSVIAAPTGSTRRCPCRPASGSARRAATTRPAASAAARTDSTASSRCSWERTTPVLPSRSRPTSNCGLTSSTRSPPGRTRAASFGMTRVSEMKDRSATSRSNGPPRSTGSTSRTLVPDRSTTRGSAAIRPAPAGRGPRRERPPTQRPPRAAPG